MLTKEFKYIDSFTGVEKTQTCYFNMTKAEILEYEMGKPGGAMAYLSHLIKLGKDDLVFDAFKELILKSYGERTPDGRFIKNQQIRDSFACSDAYSELFMEIVSSEEAMAAFVNGITPQLSPEQEAARQEALREAAAKGEIPDKVVELMQKNS